MKKPLFYGWIVVAAGMGVMAAAIGIVNNCFGLFIVPACQELGFTRQQMAGNQMMLNLGAMVTAMLAGNIFRRFGLKPMMTAGALLMCAMYFLFFVVRSLAGFYCVALAVGLSQGMINVMPFSIVIANWFHEKRGLALGLTYMGSGLGGMVFNALGGALIDRLGWRQTVVVFGVILCAVVLPLVLFAVKERPSDMGLSPLGEGAVTAPAPKPGAPAPALFTSPRFYVIGLDVVIAALAVNGIASTLTPHYTQLFDSSVAGANISAGFMASIALGKFSLGVLYDKFGAFWATLLARLLLVAALLFMTMGAGPFTIGAFLLSAGLAAATNSVAIPFLAQAVAPLTALVGLYSGLQSLGSLLSPVLCGWVFDRMGSYQFAYQMLLAAVALILPPLLMALNRSRKAPKFQKGIDKPTNPPL